MSNPVYLGSEVQEIKILDASGDGKQDIQVIFFNGSTAIYQYSRQKNLLPKPQRF